MPFKGSRLLYSLVSESIIVDSEVNNLHIISLSFFYVLNRVFDFMSNAMRIKFESNKQFIHSSRAEM